jgi:hypothetical protein
MTETVTGTERGAGVADQWYVFSMGIGMRVLVLLLVLVVLVVLVEVVTVMVTPRPPRMSVESGCARTRMVVQWAPQTGKPTCGRATGREPAASRMPHCTDGPCADIWVRLCGPQA